MRMQGKAEEVKVDQVEEEADLLSVSPKNKTWTSSEESTMKQTLGSIQRDFLTATIVPK